MGLPFSLHIRDSGITGFAADLVADRIWAELDHCDAIFSTYRPDSEISRLNRREIRVTDGDPALAEVLALAEQARERTGGVFDVRGAGPLDPSGVVKGWAAERAFQSAGISDGYLNAGGDLVLVGPPRSWRIGIEHPADASGLLTAVELGTGAIATSGQTHRGVHLWDPRCGRWIQTSWQATVVGPSLTWADILATAAAVAGPDRLDRTAWPPGYHVLLADASGTVCATTGFGELPARDLPDLIVSRTLD